jgi:hypothetical protein
VAFLPAAFLPAAFLPAAFLPSAFPPAAFLLSAFATTFRKTATHVLILVDDPQWRSSGAVIENNRRSGRVHPPGTQRHLFPSSSEHERCPVHISKPFWP